MKRGGFNLNKSNPMLGAMYVVMIENIFELLGLEGSGISVNQMFLIKYILLNSCYTANYSKIRQNKYCVL